jgi:methionyl-tRNA formyltransferase
MRIVFFGATKLGYECCERLIRKKKEIVGIFTIPQEFKISYSPDKPVKNYLFKDFTQLGKEFKVPTVIVTDKLKNYMQELKEMNPDLIVVAGWYYMIPKTIRDVAKKGCIALHASLLPKYRGNAPLVWAIINGEKDTGVTLFYLEDEVDSGDIIGQVKFPIGENESISDAIDKVREASIELLDKYIPMIENGTSPRTKQNKSEATYFPNRTPDDGLIDWNWDAKKIRDFIRAQTKPYPGAFTIIDGKKITIWDADVIDA